MAILPDANKITQAQPAPNLSNTTGMGMKAQQVVAQGAYRCSCALCKLAPGGPASSSPGTVGQVITSNGSVTDPTYQSGTVTGFATPALGFGTSSAAGAATTAIRSDSTIAIFDTTVPVTQAFGDTAATGAVAFGARRDHKHGMPSNSVANGLTGVGSFTAYAVLCAGTTSTGGLQNVSGLGNSGQVLTSAGAGALPSWQSVASGSIYKLLGTGTATTNQAITSHASPGTDITGLSVTCTPNGTNSVKISWCLPALSTSIVNDISVLVLQKDGAVILQQIFVEDATTINEFFFSGQYFDSVPTSTSHVYKLSAFATSGTLNTKDQGRPLACQNNLIVEQVG